MLKYFFEKLPTEALQSKRRALFDGLKITKDADSMRHFGQYPVIFVTFKDIKGCDSWAEMYNKIKDLLSDLHAQYLSLFQSAQLNEVELEKFNAIFKRQSDKTVLANSLKELCGYLKRVYQQDVILLIDEYDTPMHEAYLRGYSQEAMDFFRNLLSAALKDNPNVKRVVMTGITRVGKESIFSGLNNLGVYSFMSHYFATDFGFSEQEVADLAHHFGYQGSLEEIKKWYNGYNFAGHVIYNPWSVMAYLSHPEDGLQAYWANTANTELIEHALLNEPHNVLARQELETLLHGGSIDKVIEDNIILKDLERLPDTIWSLLLFSGYLTVAEQKSQELETITTLVIPNYELKLHLNKLVKNWFTGTLCIGLDVKQVIYSFLQETEETVQDLLQSLIEKNMSYHDINESFFHGFVLGLLVNLNHTHVVESNRESGLGRCDVLITPKDKSKPGVVIEFKVANKYRNEPIETALESAMAQIKARHYVSKLKQAGVSQIRLLALAFSGKSVLAQLEQVF